MGVIQSIIDGVDTFIAWMSLSLKQPVSAYCDLQTVDESTVLVAHDGSLGSIIRYDGVRGLIGNDEFQQLHEGLRNALATALSYRGHTVQVFFSHDGDRVRQDIENIYSHARQTSKELSLDLDDLFEERVATLSAYCATEHVYFVLWTNVEALSNDQLKRAQGEHRDFYKANKIPVLKGSQDLGAALADLRETHASFVQSMMNDFNHLNVAAKLLNVHEALQAVRYHFDPDVTGRDWKPLLPGDRFSFNKMRRPDPQDLSDILWPPLTDQLIPRDAENYDLRTTRVGDMIYASVFIELFPRDIRSFVYLFNRILPTNIPWRISFLVQSDPLGSVRFKSLIASILAFSSQNNRLLSDSVKMLDYINTNTDDTVVRLQVALSTWAPEEETRLLRTRAAELVKAVQGWGGCDVAEVCGDPFAGVASSTLGFSRHSVANPSLAPLSDVVYMLPITRPCSPWEQGALLFRSPDGKPWPFQPGSAMQTTWIDLIYARPGSGKSVLSNALNLALCLSAGIRRLPRIAIIDIGPSSSGLISLLREALPFDLRHQVMYHRLRLTPEYSINPFDTQLGCRFPTPQERSFLVNFLTLLATPLSSAKPYDGVPDMAGLIVDELYRQFSDQGKPTPYAPGLELVVDALLEEMGFVCDAKTTWWEVTDALFLAGFVHEAMLAQRYAMPLLADASAICRTPAVEDLYRNVRVPTGEDIISAFSRMISSAVREYPILSRVTAFDLGDARVVSLDLDEVAKSGGDAADRQTAVMYMIARYVLARNFYLTEENVSDMREQYREYHRARILEIREDPKRLIYDEFHRTAKVQAIRDQVLVDMREGRKWKVQVGLISQSVEDFDEIMIEFATSIYIMDAGPAQSVEKTARIFGLSNTARQALTQRVHGPRTEGATFLAIFATKNGINTQLLTCTLGPVELWAFSTTADDVSLRNQLYRRLGPKEARRVLAKRFPSGSASKAIETRLAELRERSGLIDEGVSLSIIEEMVQELLNEA